MPKVNLPLWVWHSQQNAAAPSQWQAYTQGQLKTYIIDADHYTILQSAEFIAQLSASILAQKINPEQNIPNTIQATTISTTTS